MTTKTEEKTPIQKQSLLILIGSITFISMGVLNILFQFTPLFPSIFPNLIISQDIEKIRLVQTIIGYVLYSITFASLIPIAIAIRNITDIYFVDHITKSGRQTAFWIIMYAIVVPLDIIALGWPVISGLIALAIITGRVMAFRKIDKTFEKIKRIFDVKIGSVFYLLFAYYALITMTLGAFAEYSEDLVFQINLSVFNGAVESLLMIVVGIKLITDIYRIKNFVETSNIQPYSAKKAFLTKDRTDTPILETTKAHIQSKTQIQKLQEKSAKQEMRIQKIRKREEARVATKEKKIESKEARIVFIICHQCKERTDRNLKFCMNCGESLKDEIISVKKEIAEVSVKRTLSPKKEKILQQITIAIFLIAFVTYAFVTDDFSLTIYAWVIIAVFATYLLVNYIVLFFSGRGFAITTVLSDGSFLLVILPVLSSILAYFIAVVVQKISDPNEINSWANISVNGYVLIILTIAFSLLSITFTLRYKINKTNMSLKEYLRYRFDFKARAEELNKDKERIEKKRANFDSLDRIEANIARQKQERVMDYEDFDFKQRLKDLGSPLTNDEED